MHPDIHALFALHQIDARIVDCERSLRRLDNGDAARAELRLASQELAAREEHLKALRVSLADFEGALKANETKQAQLSKQLYGGSVHGTREAEAMQHEIDNLKGKAGDLETSILETMDQIEAGETSLAEQRETVAKKTETLNVVLAGFQSESTVLQKKMADAQEERKHAVTGVPAPVLSKYDSVRKRTKDTGMAVLENTTCSACRMQVPGFTVNHLSNGEDLTVCDNCGRILYRQTS